MGCTTVADLWRSPRKIAPKAVAELTFFVATQSRGRLFYLGDLIVQPHLLRRVLMGDRFLSSAGAGGNCARPMRLPDPSPVLDKNRAPMGPEILSSTGAGVWRKAPMAFPDSSSVLDKSK